MSAVSAFYSGSRWCVVLVVCPLVPSIVQCMAAYAGSAHPQKRLVATTPWMWLESAHALPTMQGSLCQLSQSSATHQLEIMLAMMQRPAEICLTATQLFAAALQQRGRV